MRVSSSGDGAAGAAMLQLNGIAYSRFIGFELDGRGKAAAGFHYQSTQGFQTEVTHRHLAFRGFTDAAVLEKHPNSGHALAETRPPGLPSTQGAS